MDFRHRKWVVKDQRNSLAFKPVSPRLSVLAAIEKEAKGWQHAGGWQPRARVTHLGELARRGLQPLRALIESRRPGQDLLSGRDALRVCERTEGR